MLKILKHIKFPGKSKLGDLPDVWSRLRMKSRIAAGTAGMLMMLSSFAPDANAQTANSNFWTATDALGRKLATSSEAGGVRSNKYVGMFYWTWHTDDIATSMPVMNTTEILAKYPDAATNANSAGWQGIFGGTFWWDQPLFGYYRTTDEWLLRKHAEMLADAGIDVVFFDCTNGSYTWKSSYTVLLKVWEQARLDGVNTPKIAFLLPFGATEGSVSTLREVYNGIYKPGNYKDLWFYWNDKPLIMAYPNNLIDAGAIKFLSNEKGLGQTEVEIDTVSSAAMKFAYTVPFSGIDVYCTSYGDAKGNLTLSLYKWSKNYATTVAQAPVASKTFVNFAAVKRLAMKFTQQPMGQYLWVLSGATGKVGIWKNNNTADIVTSYFNGTTVTGNYDSKIYCTTTDGQELLAIKDFFTFRPGQPDYVNGPQSSTDWGWLEDYPQYGYAPKTNGKYEQVTVSVGQNACERSGGHCYAFNAPGTYGRSYTRKNGQDTSRNAYYKGLNFQEQWGRAFELDPDLVFVTGWNEWTAGRQQAWPPSDPYLPFAFPDEYDAERSRDIEPVKSWGDYGDIYYMQLIDNVRKFKGMESQEAPSAYKTITIGSAADWSDVKPEFKSHKGNTLHRDAKGQGTELVYTNTSGRNDIVTAKVARDKDNIYFYVETADALTPKTDANWMRLYIDADCDKSTGWQGYDYIINRVTPGDSLVVEKNAGGWNWTNAGKAAFAISGNKMEMKIKRSLLGKTSADFALEFKWVDNTQEDGNIMDFYVNGDAAPGGRFNYLYQTGTTDVNEETKTQPEKFSLQQNYPNPFNPTTNISYSLEKPGLVSLRVYNLLGQEVSTLVNSEKPAGEYTVSFDASALPSGVYVCKLNSGSFSDTIKMMFLK